MSDQLRLICCPFHNGLRDVSMGAGALRLARDPQFRLGIEARGWTISDVEIEAVDESVAEVARSMEIIRRVARETERAVAGGAFPFVLAGNCNSSLGTAAGIGADRLGVTWFDAHADFDDPEENLSGFFDVMGLAMLTGRGWSALRATIPGHRPVPEKNVILGAVRDLEPYQRETLGRSQVRAVPGGLDASAFEAALDDLATRVSRVYLHVDLDSLDVDEGRANEYAAPGGPTTDRLLSCIRDIGERLEIEAAAITAYDPAFDHDDRALRAAARIAAEISASVKHARGLR